ncbi:adenosine deaminase [Actinomadura sp. HBU206391]|uniref:adenosine deaminase n=1 Tax=Actinomadura sp. HBU206391 TaxID=2731692 RepID=UPI00164FE479|nr:adenosine deaminase [Actinomadura sp. HBU206391]MBC6462051.1 adenosine deaminase [Actinomadura sp. HBU206391]
MDLKALPKLELHSHLDCGLSHDAVRRIDPAISREDYDRDFVAPAKCASLADYLSYTLNYRAVLQTERALRIAVADAFAQLAADGVVYAELRFAPLVHLEKGLSADDVVRTVSDETVRQSEATGIDAALILCTLRHFDTADSLRTARLVERHARSGPVVALDIAGDEDAYPLDPHVPAFELVRAAGLGVTVHAGEGGGPESVWEALDKTATRRIGHGVRSIEDAALLARLEREQIHLEICPTCNVQTDAVRTLRQHPVDRLHRSGVRVGISTDTRAVTDVRLTQEYERLRDAFGWTLADFEQINRNALAAAFAAEPVKRRIVGALDQGFAEVSA